MRRAGILALISAGVVASWSQADAATTVLTFDDIPTAFGFADVPSNYGGFDNWNILEINTAPMNGSGFDHDVTSGRNLAFVNYQGPGPAEIDRSTPFNFLQAEFGAGWWINVNLEILGFLGDTQLYDYNTVVGSEGATLAAPDMYGIDRLEFITTGGSNDPHINVPHGTLEPFLTIDDFTFSTDAVPEPALWGLMLMGFFGAGLLLRHRTGKLRQLV